MTRATDLLHEAHVLAEDIRKRRTGNLHNRERIDAELTVMQSRLTTLWGQIRAARAGETDPAAAAQRPERRQTKWD